MLNETVIQQNLFTRTETKKIVYEKSYSVVSLFSGCGGMDLGFRGGFSVFGRKYAKNPFKIIWANEINQAACRTYRRNLDENIHCGDIWDFMDELPKNADVLIGGFPCQDLSINGKGLGINGKRSGQYRAMVEAIKIVKPQVFVAENVKGLLLKTRRESFLKIMDDFRSLGYDVSHSLYHAADYGVPQSRERVFIVGTSNKTGKFAPPEPEYSKENWITASEAIGDLETKEMDESVNHIWSAANLSGEQGNRRLVANRPGFTIRAECHGNIQFHYSLPRRISMREAARIQSFPDDFIFEAKLRETERQIGNAVPPVLAWHVAKSVANCLANEIL
ncbi:MAG TPA: DNA cytosine methyltransferase [Pyrinomonadaceae bacterium]|nr:DNA cytosine methyltransferase [Pyrinomonadaceae bacterium]